MQNARAMEGPVLIHVMTTKGKGYEPAEQTPDQFHGVGPFDVATGKGTRRQAGRSFLHRGFWRDHGPACRRG